MAMEKELTLEIAIVNGRVADCVGTPLSLTRTVKLVAGPAGVPLIAPVAGLRLKP
jgi:hypothetical protein